MTQRSWNDSRIEEIIGALLRAGVLLSAAVVFCGAVLYLVRHGGTPVDYRTFRGESPEFRSVSGVLHGVAHLSARAIIQLGLVLLIATPVARVMFSAVAFALERDRMYVAITVVVLAVLLYSLFGSALRGSA